MAVRAPLTPAQVLGLLPQKPPFRFLDELLEIDAEHAIGRYAFKPAEFFYAGHFPQDPVTPGVILLEAMAQTGLVALGMYLMALEVGPEELGRYLTVFTDGEFEFAEIVRPGDRVLTRAQKVYWRRNKLRSRVEMLRETDGKAVARGEVAGLGVRRD